MKIITILAGLVFGLIYASVSLPLFFVKNWLEFSKAHFNKVQGAVMFGQFDRAVQLMSKEEKRLFDKFTYANDDFFVNSLIKILTKLRDQNAAEFEARKIAGSLDAQFGDQHVFTKILVRNAILSEYAKIHWDYDNQKAVIIGPVLTFVPYCNTEDPISQALHGAGEKGVVLCATMTNVPQVPAIPTA